MIENSVAFIVYGNIKNLLKVQQNPHISQPTPFWKICVAGGVSGFCVAYCLTPIELVKCNVQVGLSEGSKRLTVISFIQSEYRKNGVKGFWKGNLSCLMREIPGSIAWFGTYELIKSRFIQPYFEYEYIDDIPLYFTAVAGSFAGVAYWFIPYPFDTLKSTLQTTNRFKNVSLFSTLSSLVKENGFKSLYKGCLITCLRAAVAHGALFFSYECLFRRSNVLFE